MAEDLEQRGEVGVRGEGRRELGVEGGTVGGGGRGRTTPMSVGGSLPNDKRRPGLFYSLFSFKSQHLLMRQYH